MEAIDGAPDQFSHWITFAKVEARPSGFPNNHKKPTSRSAKTSGSRETHEGGKGNATILTTTIFG